MPDVDAVPSLTSSFAACLAAATEASVDEMPAAVGDIDGSISMWRGWLAGRGVGLVPIANPASFQWPGYWVAIVDGCAVLMFGSPSGVVLSPQDPSLVGSAAGELPVRLGYALGGLDPALNSRPAPRARLQGRVEAIAVADRATGPMHRVDKARAFAGRGLEGDRYAAKVGTFTPKNGLGFGYDLTLIEAEVVEALSLPDGGRLEAVDARRNLITRGIDLNALVGRRFRVGDVECAGRRLCEPCAHLERLTLKGVLRPLIHRGGLRADVLSDGVISTGSAIETID